MPIINCLICGEEKYFKPSQIKYGFGKYCSRQCLWKSKLGKKFSPETCLKMSKARMGHPDYLTPEARIKIGLKMKGKKLSQWHKDKISQSLKGKQPKNSIYWKNSNHPEWKGNKVKRVALHQWVAYHKGRPTHCIDCGKTSDKLYWSNIDHKYRRVLSDYQGRCAVCHRKYDLKNIFKEHYKLKT